MFPDFCLKNDITGEVLTMGQAEVDGRGQFGENANNYYFLLIRRRPQIGPIRSIDLRPFDDTEHRKTIQIEWIIHWAFNNSQQYIIKTFNLLLLQLQFLNNVIN